MGESGTLGAAFSSVTVIDTSAFIRAQKRWRIAIEDGKLRWARSPTLPGTPIDDLLDNNIAALEQYSDRLLAKSRAPAADASAQSAAA